MDIRKGALDEGKLLQLLLSQWLIDSSWFSVCSSFLWLNDDNSSSAARLLEMITNEMPVSQKHLLEKQIEVSGAKEDFLRNLIQEGLLYGDDDGDQEE